MRCYKCGSSVEHPNVFCKACRKDMEKHPVSRETPAVILPRPKAAPMRVRTTKPEELLNHAKRVQKVLFWMVLTLFITLVLAASLILYLLSQRSTGQLGQTYTPNITDQSSSNNSSEPGGVGP